MDMRMSQQLGQKKQQGKWEELRSGSVPLQVTTVWHLRTEEVNTCSTFISEIKICEVSVLTLFILWRGTLPHLHEADSTLGPDRWRLPARAWGGFQRLRTWKLYVLNRCYMDGYQMLCCEQGKTLVDKWSMLSHESSGPTLYEHKFVGMLVGRCSTEAGLMLLHWIHIQPRP